MKISKNYLKKIIKEELSAVISEMSNEREMVEIYVRLHNALINKEKNLGKNLKIVKDEESFEDILDEIKTEKNMSAYDLYEDIKNFKDKIDSNMYERLRDAFQNKIYEEDAEYIKEPEKDDDELDAEMSDMYRKIYGKPDLRIVK